MKAKKLVESPAEIRSRTMAAVKSKGGRSTERALRARLVARGVRGWRMNVGDLPGKPDFVFDAEKLAVFVDGCFWHGCPKCYRRPKTSRAYWDNKIAGNMRRDLRQAARLRRLGWSVMRVREHELTAGQKIVGRILARLRR